MVHYGIGMINMSIILPLCEWRKENLYNYINKKYPYWMQGIYKENRTRKIHTAIHLETLKMTEFISRALLINICHIIQT